MLSLGLGLGVANRRAPAVEVPSNALAIGGSPLKLENEFLLLDTGLGRGVASLALTFDGANDFVNPLDDYFLNSTFDDAFILVWFRINGASLITRYLLSTEFGTYSLQINTNRTLTLTHAGVSISASTPAVNIADWNCFAFSYSKAAYAQMFLNGSVFSPSTNGNAIDMADFVLGCLTGGINTNFFDGDMGEVIVHGGASLNLATAANRDKIYKNGKIPDYGLTGSNVLGVQPNVYFKMDESSGLLLNSGAGGVGEIQGTLVSADGPETT